MKAVILAAGLGSRLNPLTQTRPKHLLPIAGEPLIGHIVSTLSEIGIRDIGVVVHHFREKIEEYLRVWSVIRYSCSLFNERVGRKLFNVRRTSLEAGIRELVDEAVDKVMEFA